MMLDSALGKILTKQHVGPSKPVPNEKIAKSNTDSQAPNSEAEIRLVVRLLVEEHIVFNGKVEEIKQLESEEVSRIVSRIAWAGAGAIDDSTTENKQAKVCQEADYDPVGTQLPSTTLSDSTNQNTPSSPVLREVIMEKNQENETLDINNQSTLSISKPNKQTSIDKDEHIAQASDNLVQGEKTSSCDTQHKAKRIRHTSEAASPPVHTYKPIQKTSDKDVDQADEEMHQDDTASNCQLEAKLSPDYHEFQSITETLNDCVNSVDIMSRTISDGTDVCGSDKFKSRLEHNDSEVCLTANIVKLHSVVEGKIDLIELKAEFKPSNQFIEDSTQAETKVINLDTKMNAPKKPEGTKKKSTADNSLSSKKIRRAGPKDHQRKKKSSDNSRLIATHEAGHITMMSIGSCHLSRNSRIFAKWSDNHYYPGTILRPSKDRKFVVGFFDGAQRNVAETDLIPLCNIDGKQVRVSIAKNYCVNAIVHDQRPPVDGQPMFDVEYQQDGLVRKCVPLNDIFLTAEQGAPLISQTIRPEKNPDESLFAGVDLDNIVHVKRSRRLQELEDLDIKNSPSSADGTTGPSIGRRKRGQYNMRSITQRTPKSVGVDAPNEQQEKVINYNEIHQETPASSCSPENVKTNLNGPNSNLSCEGSNSTESSNTPTGLDMGQEFYFDSSSPHRTGTSLLL